MCAQFSSLSCSVFVTLDCTPHRVAQVSLVRVISWSSHDERISSILSPPFPSTSSSSYSSLISCTSSCTSSTTLRAVATLRTSLERRWTLLTTPTSSHMTCAPSSSRDWFQEETSLKRDRQSVFFTVVNPMYASQHLEEVQCDLGKPRITVYKNTWKFHQHTEYRCNLRLAQRRGLQFYQTRSHAMALFNTLPAICIEKAVFMKTGKDLYCKVYQSPRLPRVILTPNLQHGRQDPSNPEARNGPNHGPVWKIQSFLLNEICTAILWQDYYGKGNSRFF